VGKPIGLINAPGSLTVTRATGGQIQYADLVVMMAKLPPISFGSAIWHHSLTAVPQLLQLRDGAGRAVFLQNQVAANQRPLWSLAGFPAFPTEKLPAPGTKGDLILVDPAFYVIGDRMTLEIAVSEQVKFLTNQLTWRVVSRVDGQLWPEKAITLQDNSTQVSPSVILN
jgi:HK97 family phage major capsid protein